MQSLPTGAQDRDTERSEQIRQQPPASDNDVLVLQVRAFLEAGNVEDIELDVETVEDIMQAIPEDFGAEVDPVGDLEPVDDDGLERDTSGDSHQASDEVDPSLLYGIDEEDKDQTWTAQDIKEMMHHLKERGQHSHQSVGGGVTANLVE
ncbi:hypothetical protein H0H87_004401 [Tephrocybe sp. NHM501043]|nr:hypothetical protein H0H87_004401 [Tephrocybe sp. NHM501043]